MPDNPLFVPALRPPQVGTAKAINLRPNSPTVAASKRANVQSGAMKSGDGGKQQSGKKTGKARGSRNNGDKGVPYTNPSFSDSSSSSSSSSDSFQVESNRTLFYDDNRDEPITFDLPLKDTTAILPLESVETKVDANLNDNSKFMVNLATYVRYPFSTGNSNLDYPVYEHYRTIFSAMQKQCMAAIQSKLVDDFTFGNFYNYMQAVSSALEAYYTIDAILSYTSKTDDRNSGVIALQERLTQADLFTAKNELMRALKGHWFPPKFSELIRWTYQIYKTSPTHQGCNYMFLPSEDIMFLDTSDDNAARVMSLIQAQVVSITSSSSAATFSRLASILGKVYPEGIIRGLPLSTNRATFDPQHYEIFVNQPVFFKDGSTMKSYPAADVDGEITYARSCNPEERSGMPFCLQNVNSTAALTAEQMGGARSIDFFRCMYQDQLASSNYSKTNKWTLARNPSLGFISRNIDNITNESADVHMIEVDTSNTLKRRISCQKSGYQRVYFDNLSAPLINMRNMLDMLFNFVN